MRRGDRGFQPVIKSGFVKCKISKKRWNSSGHFLCPNAEYGTNIKNYLEARCVNECEICFIRLFDKNNWSDGYYCAASAHKEGEFLILDFQEGVGHGGADGDHHTVMMKDITKDSIEKIHLDFENCEGIEIFGEEIQDIRIEFDNELIWNSSCYARRVRSGYIRLKLDKSIT